MKKSLTSFILLLVFTGCSITTEQTHSAGAIATPTVNEENFLEASMSISPSVLRKTCNQYTILTKKQNFAANIFWVDKTNPGVIQADIYPAFIVPNMIDTTIRFGPGPISIYQVIGNKTYSIATGPKRDQIISNMINHQQNIIGYTALYQISFSLNGDFKIPKNSCQPIYYNPSS